MGPRRFIWKIPTWLEHLAQANFTFDGNNAGPAFLLVFLLVVAHIVAPSPSCSRLLRNGVIRLQVVLLLHRWCSEGNEHLDALNWWWWSQGPVYLPSIPVAWYGLLNSVKPKRVFWRDKVTFVNKKKHEDLEHRACFQVLFLLVRFFFLRIPRETESSLVL